MSAFLHGTAGVIACELRYRVRRVSWYVVIGAFFGLVALGTVLVYFIVGLTAGGTGEALYSGVVYVVAILSVFFIPALSGSALNRTRVSGSGAEQHRITSDQPGHDTADRLVLGKFLAAWLAALALLAVSLPALAFAVITADTMPAGTAVPPTFVAVAPLLLVVQFGVVAACGVGCSGIFSRPLFSIAASYLVSVSVGVVTLLAWLFAVAFRDVGTAIPEWAIALASHLVLSLGALYWALRRARAASSSNSAGQPREPAAR